MTAIVCGSVALWFAVLGLMLLGSRTRPAVAGPATPDPGGTEPPAVVSLIANGWRLGGRAVEATLLDLAARRFVEIHRSMTDPALSTVTVLPPPEDSLDPHEQQVLDHVRKLAGADGRPVPARELRDRAPDRKWCRRFRTAVFAEARHRGLARRRLGFGATFLMAFAALGPGAAMGLVVLDHPEWSRYPPGHKTFVAVLMIAFLLGFGLANWFGSAPRDTLAGLDAAARWLGLREYLDRHAGVVLASAAAGASPDAIAAYAHALGVAPQMFVPQIGTPGPGL